MPGAPTKVTISSGGVSTPSGNPPKTELPPPPSFKEAKVVYVYDRDLAKCTDNIVHIYRRSKMVHQLISGYLLLKLLECKPGRLATKEDLLQFHSQDYVQFLFDAECGDDGVLTEDEDVSHPPNHSLADSGGSAMDRNSKSSRNCNQDDNLDEFGLGYDCPVFKGLGEFSLRIAGGTIVAAEELVNGADIAINWCGGWHHAQRSEASGFCYVNDIVLGIHKLQAKFKHILYVDLDSHHGDGVENAFAFSNKIMTLSFHHFNPGYFPGTGNVTDVGQGRGKYYSVNVPLKAGITDTQYKFVFDSVFNSVLRNFQPEALVVQCGADCLAKDPLGAFNLTLDGILHCVDTILCSRTPALFLGGGGYNITNAARLWTSITAKLVGKKLSNDLPDNLYFLKFGPDYELAVQPSLRRNDNDDEYIGELIQAITGNLILLQKGKEAEK